LLRLISRLIAGRLKPSLRAIVGPLSLACSMAWIDIRSAAVMCA
jgi:hypothetical protein